MSEINDNEKNIQAVDESDTIANESDRKDAKNSSGGNEKYSESTECVSKTKRNVLTAVLAFAIAFILFVWVVVGYLLYVVCSYSRLPDNMELVVNNNTQMIANAEQYKIVTYNVGFGAYSPDYTFFMDTGVMKDGTKTQGKYGTARSKSEVERNIGGAANTLKELNPDFAIIQEVDYDSTRSYKVDQREYFSFDGYASVFACNYHSSYLMYPFNDPHGKNNAGIMTLSKYAVTDSTRYSFPIADGFSKFTDLDRCFSVTHISVDGGKTLSVISLHMSAYDEGGVIRKKQAELLKSVLEREYSAGNYVIAGGDFNQDLIGNLEKFESAQAIPEWVASFDSNSIPDGFSIVADDASTVGSCRGADIEWKRNYNYTCVIDGFIVSDNVTVKSVNIVDTDFAYSDHNPVELVFELA